MKGTALEVSAAKPTASLTPNPGLTPMMLNHAAWVTHDVAATTAFYTRIMGMELASTILDDHVPSTGDQIPYFHIFFRMGDGSTLAFFEAPGVIYRMTTGETELSGVRLEADMKIGVFLGAANRDPRQFQDADVFDVDRAHIAANHLALGTGIHACIGQMIARGESEALLGALCRRAVRLELTAAATYRPINQMRMIDKLPMRIHAA